MVTKSSSAKAVFCAALGNIIWGFSFLFTKVALSAVPDSNVMLSHRFIFATLIMIILVLTGKGKLSFKGKDWKPAVLLMLMMVCYYLFETQSLRHTNATVTGMVLAVVPVATIGTGILFLREYPTRRQALFCIMPVAGVIIMTVSGQELGIVSTIGIVFLILCMLASAGYKTVNRKMAAQFSSFERTFLILSASAVFFSIIGMTAVDWDVTAFVAPLLQGKYLISVLCLSVLCSITANLLVNYAANNMSDFKLSSFGSLSTLCSALAGVLFLQEPMSISILLGIVLILVDIREVTKQK